ncbi:dynein axonemal heavy chain 5-like [Schistocerca gregaria]|uniref:dynein axonemal heavy chain 5-like n=1 Tax=Schistocerca gregaria TaxID=7010 RepID=UPI00211E1689|nr:dynein axonemal heavy chain 5-like [Schistocerca gregaria]
MGLTATHRFIMEQAALHMNIDANLVEEGVLDANRHTELLHSLVAQGGRQALFFMCADMDPPGPESGRPQPADGKAVRGPRVIVSDGKDTRFEGLCAIVYRNTSRAIEQKNVTDDLSITSMTSAGGAAAALEAVRSVPALFLQPALRAWTVWGAASSVDSAGFQGDLADCVYFLGDTKRNIDELVVFHIPPELTELLPSPDVVKSVLDKDTSIIGRVEYVITVWTRQIEQVLTRAERLRSVREDTGPLDELHQWRRLLARFGSVAEHTASPTCQTFVILLTVARSKLAKHTV